MKLGVNLGYWGSEWARRTSCRWSRKPNGSDTTPSGQPRPTAQTPRPCSRGWQRGTTTIRLGSAIFQMPGRSARDDRDDRGDD